MSSETAVKKKESCSDDPSPVTAVKKKPISLPVSPPATGVVLALDDFPSLDVFDQERVYPALLVPVKRTAQLRKTLKTLLWRRPKMKNVYNDPNDEHRRILVLNDDTAWTDATVRQLLNKDCQRTTYTIRLTYNDLSVDEVFRQLLPVQEIPSSYETVGRLAHVNLRDDCLPFQYWIGKVLLDKNQPRIQTVVNKLGSIGTQFRTFAMHVIAGNSAPGWSRVTVQEEGSMFELDFTKVYWNSRLAGEHARLVRYIQDEARQSQRSPTIVADLMGGVGPFAVPLTRPQQPSKKNQQQPSLDKIVVYANDLNPASFQYLERNAQLNKCRNLHCSNLDARALAHKLQDDGIEVHHVIMNLPASAPEFLDAFRGYTCQQLPTMHVHCFAPKQGDFEKDTIQRCEHALGCSLDHDRVEIRIVRDVAPNKNMLCLSFELPQAVRDLPRICLVAEPVQGDEPDTKRLKSDKA